MEYVYAVMAWNWSRSDEPSVVGIFSTLDKAKAWAEARAPYAGYDPERDWYYETEDEEESFVIHQRELDPQ